MSDRPHVTDERSLDGPLLAFDTAQLLRQMRAEETWHRGTHDAMTLTKSRGLRVVLVAMHRHTVLPWHQTAGPLSLQLLEGELEFNAGSQTVTLRAGELVTLAAGVRHRLTALRDAAFLLTLATEEPHAAERQPSHGASA